MQRLYVIRVVSTAYGRVPAAFRKKNQKKSDKSLSLFSILAIAVACRLFGARGSIDAILRTAGGVAVTPVSLT